MKNLVSSFNLLEIDYSVCDDYVVSDERSQRLKRKRAAAAADEARAQALKKKKKKARKEKANRKLKKIMMESEGDSSASEDEEVDAGTNTHACTCIYTYAYTPTCPCWSYMLARDTFDVTYSHVSSLFVFICSETNSERDQAFEEGFDDRVCVQVL